MDHTPHEQKLVVYIFVKLDFVDILKCLFGRALKITTNINIPQEKEISHFNHSAKTEIVPTTEYFTKKNKPDFGYSPKN